MTILSPEHLLQQAEKLIEPPRAGRPRQVDIRRAISSIYYALFHTVLTDAADGLLGAANRGNVRYGLVYRSVAHRTLRELCEEIQKPTLRDRYKPFEPSGGFEKGLKEFAAAVVDLQQKRYDADYNPLARLKRSDVQVAVNTGRSALVRFRGTSDEHRQIFASLLLFPLHRDG